MLQPLLSQVRTVLCLGAHSDDIEIGCGATILSLLEANPLLNVHWVVLSGNETRAKEARQSAERFLTNCQGRIDIQVHSFRDSYFPANWQTLKVALHELSSQLSPDLIFTHRSNDRHQDHRVVSELTWCAFRNHLILEYEIPKYEGDLGQPNVFIPVSSRNAKLKSEILLDSFESQRSKPWFDEETFLALLRLRGLEANSSSRYAEAFHASKLCLTVCSSESSFTLDSIEKSNNGIEKVSPLV